MKKTLETMLKEGRFANCIFPTETLKANNVDVALLVKEGILIPSGKNYITRKREA